MLSLLVRSGWQQVPQTVSRTWTTLLLQKQLFTGYPPSLGIQRILSSRYHAVIYGPTAPVKVRRSKSGRINPDLHYPLITAVRRAIRNTGVPLFDPGGYARL